MLSSSELRFIEAALPTLNSLPLLDFESLGNLVVQKIKCEATPTTEKHLGSYLWLPTMHV